MPNDKPIPDDTATRSWKVEMTRIVLGIGQPHTKRQRLLLAETLQMVEDRLNRMNQLNERWVGATKLPMQWHDRWLVHYTAGMGMLDTMRGWALDIVAAVDEVLDQVGVNPTELKEPEPGREDKG